MTDINLPKLLFPYGFDERRAVESEQRGYYGHAIVELSDGKRVGICFYDTVRLSQDLATVSEFGEVCIAEPGMIVIPSVTLEYMQRAVQHLHASGFFESLVPLVDTEKNES